MNSCSALAEFLELYRLSTKAWNWKELSRMGSYLNFSFPSFAFFLFIPWSFCTFIQCILIISTTNLISLLHICLEFLSHLHVLLFSFSDTWIIWFDLGLYICSFSFWISLCLVWLMPLYPSGVSLKFTEWRTASSFSVLDVKSLHSWLTVLEVAYTKSPSSSCL